MFRNRVKIFNLNTIIFKKRLESFEISSKYPEKKALCWTKTCKKQKSLTWSWLKLACGSLKEEWNYLNQLKKTNEYKRNPMIDSCLIIYQNISYINIRKDFIKYQINISCDVFIFLKIKFLLKQITKGKQDKFPLIKL